MLRALGLERRLPPQPLVQALLLAATLAFLAILVRRALLHLGAEPTCATCGRYLRRERLGRVTAEDATRLAQAWARGEPVEPQVDAAARGPDVLRETCSAGHTVRPGWALVHVRSRSLGSGGAGLVARLPAESAVENSAGNGAAS